MCKEFLNYFTHIVGFYFRCRYKLYLYRTGRIGIRIAVLINKGQQWQHVFCFNSCPLFHNDTHHRLIICTDYLFIIWLILFVSDISINNTKGVLNVRDFNGRQWTSEFRSTEKVFQIHMESEGKNLYGTYLVKLGYVALNVILSNLLLWYYDII